MDEGSVQLSEDVGQILITIVDETYAIYDDDSWPAQREIFRDGLETEFAASFEDVDIGPGASLPAFATPLQTTAVPVWTLLIGTFLLGKPIKENLSAWRDIGRSIRKFFTRRVYLDRQGAAVLAVETVLRKLETLPTAVRLLSYRTVLAIDSDSLTALERDTELAKPLPTSHLGFIRHVFEIDADGTVYRVVVDGKDVECVKVAR